MNRLRLYQNWLATLRGIRARHRKDHRMSKVITIGHCRHEPLPDGQVLSTILERITAMSDQISHLQASVDKELSDDSAQVTLIAELQAQVAAAQTALAPALAGEAQAKTDLQTALDAASAAATKLDSDDAADAPPVTPAPAPAPTPAPAVDPTPAPAPAVDPGVTPTPPAA